MEAFGFYAKQYASCTPNCRKEESGLGKKVTVRVYFFEENGREDYCQGG